MCGSINPLKYNERGFRGIFNESLYRSLGLYDSIFNQHIKDNLEGYISPNI